MHDGHNVKCNGLEMRAKATTVIRPDTLDFEPATSFYKFILGLLCTYFKQEQLFLLTVDF